MDQSDIDLCYVEQDGQRQMMAVAISQDWHSPMIPAKDAILPLSGEVMRRFPGLFATEKDVQTFLMIIHFANMSRDQNSAGQSYPVQLG